MEESSCLCYLPFFSLLSPLLFIVDVVLDLWAVVSLYEEQKYSSVGLLVFLLLTSSVLLQIFSWMWYSDSNNIPETKVERFIINHGLLTLVHILQLGVFLRILAVVEISIRSFKQNTPPQEVAVNSTPDLIVLLLFKAFSESAPQLILMMVLIMQMQELYLFTVIKIAGSLSCMAFSVLSYHRSMRAFVPEKLKMGWSSSIIYFLWNLFLIGTRVVCMSLFASVLPCYITAHFLSLWTLLVLWAWWQKTDFMDTKAGEWLYRATVGLIWYFTWFNVASGNKKLKGIIYHMVMGADTMLLLGLWWWKRSVESARLSPLPINPYLLIVMLMIIYIIGLALKLVYYWKFHPDQKYMQLDKKNGKLLMCLHNESRVEISVERTVLPNYEGETEARETLDPEREGETEASETLDPGREGETEARETLDPEHEGETEARETLDPERAGETEASETLDPGRAGRFDYEGETEASETLDPGRAGRFDSEGETEASETLKPNTEPEDKLSVLAPPQRIETGVQKRMRRMAINFYC